ncbi:MAG: fluoride exporter [Clostridiales bacterium]|nr:fluoride exporter [Clostridiales bacterium]MDN5281390.1 fluoride exporter [Candidatus Ozemobacter sp.]
MSNPLTLSLLVGFGGFVGSLTRYGVSLLAQRFVIDWPLGTFSANVLGCLTIGLVAGISAQGETLTPAMRLALTTGFCGGFTTMSSMIYETAEMIRASEYLHAGTYVAFTFILSLSAFFTGLILIRYLTKLGGI